MNKPADKVGIYIDGKKVAETPYPGLAVINNELEKTSSKWEFIIKDSLVDSSEVSMVMKCTYKYRKGLRYYFCLPSLSKFSILIEPDQEDDFKRFKFKRNELINVNYGKPGRIRLYR